MKFNLKINLKALETKYLLIVNHAYSLNFKQHSRLDLSTYFTIFAFN